MHVYCFLTSVSALSLLGMAHQILGVCMYVYWKVRTLYPVPKDNGSRNVPATKTQDTNQKLQHELNV